MNKEQLMAEIKAIEAKLANPNLDKKAKEMHTAMLAKVKAELAKFSSTPANSKSAELQGYKDQRASLLESKAKWEGKLKDNPEKADFYNEKIKMTEDAIEDLNIMITTIEEEIAVAAKKAAEKPIELPPSKPSTEKTALLESLKKAEKNFAEAEEDDEKAMFKTDIDLIKNKLAVIEAAEKKAAETNQKPTTPPAQPNQKFDTTQLKKLAEAFFTELAKMPDFI